MAQPASRRLALRVALKLLALAAFAAIFLVFFGSLLPGERPQESLALDLTRLEPGQVLRTDWRGHRYLVLRRSPALQQALRLDESSLADPRSLHSEQPPSMATPLRSAGGEFFVALDYDPDFGCPLDYVPPGAPSPLSPWPGGFHAPCSDSWFDPAGRVYSHQRTVHNLRVPPHHLAEGRLVLDP